MSRGLALRQWLFRAGLGRLRRPAYPYQIEPAALAFLVQQLDATRHLGGAVLEVGVWRGLTTVFLNEHMDRTGDERPYVAIDTFSGFTERDIAHEAAARGKQIDYRPHFKVNDAEVFQAHVASYPRVRVIARDIANVGPDDVGDVSLALLDVDLHEPTRRALTLVERVLRPGGVVVVDDVIDDPGYGYDGAAAAYFEFCRDRGVAPEYVGGKAGVIRSSA